MTRLRELLDRDTGSLGTDMGPFIKLWRDRADAIDSYFKKALGYISKASDKPLQRMQELFVQMAG